MASFSWSPIFNFSSDKLFWATANLYFNSFSFCLNYFASFAFSSYLLINLSYLSFCYENCSFSLFISAFDAYSNSFLYYSYCSTFSSYFWKSFLYFSYNFCILTSNSPFSFYKFLIFSSSTLIFAGSLYVWKKSLFLLFLVTYSSFLFKACFYSVTFWFKAFNSLFYFSKSLFLIFSYWIFFAIFWISSMFELASISFVLFVYVFFNS